MNGIKRDEEGILKRRTFLKGTLAAAGGVFVGGIAYAYQSRKVQISHERYVPSKLKQGIRIVAVSDIHAPCLYSSALDLVGIVNAAEPDFFVLAGDIVDKPGNEWRVEMFQAVKARFAKVATLGNWEYLGKLDLVKLKTTYERAGISLLVNEVLEAHGLIIVGFDDLVLGSPDHRILADLPAAGHPVLAISHCPGYFDTLTALSVNPLLVVSGHTHGGQIAPFGLVLVTPRGSGPYVQGWYQKGEHFMYVTRGIGTSPGLPLRMGARPEVVVLDLNKDKA